MISSFLSITKDGCGNVFHKLEKKFSKSFFDTLKPIIYHNESVKFINFVNILENNTLISHTQLYLPKI